MNPNRSSLLYFLPLLLSPTACYSLAEDVTPPPGYEYQSQVLSSPTDELTEVVYYPLVPPDPVEGAAIYAEKCTACHGQQGLGDGPQANQLPNPVAPIGDPALARQSKPNEWYRIITDGNIERYMPPFVSLTERQRWDVVAYVYTLGSSSAQDKLGHELYQENCAACHGVTGQGDGPDGMDFAQKPFNFTDQALMADHSAAALFEGMTHSDELGTLDFESQFSSEERWALTDFLRSLTFTAASSVVASDLDLEAEPLEVSEAKSASDTAQFQGSVTGQVINASGGELSPDLEVTLHGYDQFQEVFSESLSIQPDGSFAFEGVEMPEGRAILVSADYDQGTYTSDIVVAREGVKNMSLSVTVFETSNDTAALSVDRLHVFFDFVSSETVRVAELYVISNASNEVVVAPERGQPVINFVLPEGATNLQFKEGKLGERYVQIPGGFGDTQEILPGASQHEVLFSFDMSYDRELDLSQPLGLPVSAVIAFVPDVGVRVNSDLLREEGKRDLQGTPYLVYASNNLAADSQLPIMLSGRPKVDGANTIVVGSAVNLVVGLGSLGVVVTVAARWLYRYRQSGSGAGKTDAAILRKGQFLAPVAEMDAESLMDAIIALDDRYQASELAQESYLQRRMVLKEQLRKLVS